MTKSFRSPDDSSGSDGREPATEHSTTQLLFSQIGLPATWESIKGSPAGPMTLIMSLSTTD